MHLPFWPFQKVDFQYLLDPSSWFSRLPSTSDGEKGSEIECILFCLLYLYTRGYVVKLEADRSTL